VAVRKKGIRLGGSPSSVKGLSIDQRHAGGSRGRVKTATEGIVVLIGRVLFAVFFIRSGIAHVRKHEGMKGYARSTGFPFPSIGGWPAGVSAELFAEEEAARSRPSVGRRRSEKSNGTGCGCRRKI
jgi:hypothetical protein